MQRIEDYPGQTYYWKHSPNIKRAEQKFYADNSTERKMSKQDQANLLQESVKRIAALAADATQSAETRLQAEHQLVSTLQFLSAAYGV